MYGWDWYTYHAQPLGFLNVIIEKYKIDVQKQKAQERANATKVPKRR